MATDPANPAVNPPRRDVDREVVQAWLDALSTSACDEQEFLGAVEKLSQRSAEAGWDALSLLDQYYRLGKIPSEVFGRLKSSLSSQLVGAGTNSGELSVPLPQRAEVDAQSAPRTPPTPTPAAQVSRTAPRPIAATRARPPAVAEAAGGDPAAPAKPVAAVEPLRRSARQEIAVGEVLRGRYVIKSVLGRGGTGTVFEAADLYRVDLPESGQRVALKVLHGQIAGKPQLFSELQREFQLLQSLSHPNVVRAFDLDRDGDLAFLTMEFLRGLSLTGVLAARNQVRFERAHALAIVRDVAGAIGHAHSRAVVHGDLNPGNIFITNEGEIRVLDFGAAHTSLGGPDSVRSDRSITDRDPALRESAGPRRPASRCPRRRVLARLPHVCAPQRQAPLRREYGARGPGTALATVAAGRAQPERVARSARGSHLRSRASARRRRAMAGGVRLEHGSAAPAAVADARASGAAPTQSLRGGGLGHCSHRCGAGRGPMGERLFWGRQEPAADSGERLRAADRCPNAAGGSLARRHAALGIRAVLRNDAAYRVDAACRISAAFSIGATFRADAKRRGTAGGTSRRAAELAGATSRPHFELAATEPRERASRGAESTTSSAGPQRACLGLILG